MRGLIRGDSMPPPSLLNGAQKNARQRRCIRDELTHIVARTLLLLPVVRCAVCGRDAASRRGDSTNDSFRTTPDGFPETALLLFGMKRTKTFSYVAAPPPFLSLAPPYSMCASDAGGICEREVPH